MRNAHYFLKIDETDRALEPSPDNPADETAPVLFALTRTEIALVEMVHARAREGAQEGDAAIALAAAQDAVAEAEALDNELYTSLDYMARAKFWLAVVLFYTGGDVDVESAMKEADALSQHLDDDALSLHFGEWMEENRVSTPVSKVALGYRQNLGSNPTWKRQRRSSGEDDGNDDGTKKTM